MFTRKVMRFSLVLHLCCAWFSGGFYQYDEHFQILEFMNALLGKTPFHDLPWEYHFQMRSWLQPFFYLGIQKLDVLLGVGNPIVQAFTFRLVTAVLGWVSLFMLASRVDRFIKKIEWQKTAIFLLATLWCIPYIHARTSGENLGGSLFWISFCIFIDHPKSFSRLFGSGLLMGLAFLLRFQIGFMIAGFGLYSLMVRRTFPVVKFGLGFLVALTLGLIADRVGYGVWTLSAMNYFRENILAGKVGSFGHLPWWELLFQTAFVLPPVSTVLFGFGAVGLWRNPRSLMFWTVTPFLLIHCLITWKELRFWFPLVPVFPVLAVMGMEALLDWNQIWVRAWVRWVTRGLIIVNGVVLIFLSLRYGNSAYPFFSYALENHGKQFEFYSISGDPYAALGLRYRYYEPESVKVHLIDRPAELGEAMKAATLDRPVLLFSEGGELPEPFRVMAPSCKIEFSVFPRWLKHFDFGHWMSRSHVWQLYQCSSPGA